MLVSILSDVVMDSSRGERFGVLESISRAPFLETGSGSSIWTGPTMEFNDNAGKNGLFSKIGVKLKPMSDSTCKHTARQRFRINALPYMESPNVTYINRPSFRVLVATVVCAVVSGCINPLGPIGKGPEPALRDLLHVFRKSSRRAFDKQLPV
jgi:hypothetical protein